MRAVIYDLCREPRRQARPGLPRRLARHPRLRRLRGLQGLDRQRCNRGRLHGPRPAQVLRTSGTRQSQIAGEALERIAALYAIEQVREADAKDRQALRQAQAQPLLEDFKAWLLACQQDSQRSSSAKAIDYTLKRWAALTHYLTDGRVLIDNNWIENQIRPIAIGRRTGLCRLAAPASGLRRS